MLPAWKVTPLERGKIGIECPRKDCGQKAVVMRKAWTEGRNVRGLTNSRPCTYCFRVARVPE